MQLTDFQNKHRGRLALILGAGPSLHYEKLEGAAAYVTIAVESAILKYKVADYFIADDPSVMDWDYFYHLLPRIRSHCFLYEDVFRETADRIPQERLTFYKQRPWFNGLTATPTPAALVMSNDPSTPFVGTRTPMASALNLAHLMGCDPMVLLGADCCYLQDKQYCWNYPGEAKPQRLKGQPVPARKQLVRGKIVDDENRETIEYLTQLGRSNPYSNIINASTQGVLDCFPKVPYADVLARFKTLTK